MMDFFSSCSVPERTTTIDYCKSTVHQPLTQYEAVQELLQQSEETTKAVCKKYTINTFNLGVCKKALPLIWTFLDKFKEHFVIDSCNGSNLDAALNDQSTIELIQRYLEFQNFVRYDILEKTGKLWLSFMEQFKPILVLIYPVKTHNMKLFHYCNGEMAILFFAYVGHNYSHYLTWMEAFMANLKLKHHLLIMVH